MHFLWHPSSNVLELFRAQCSFIACTGCHNNVGWWLLWVKNLTIISQHVLGLMMGSVMVTLFWPPCLADADIIFSSCGFFFYLYSTIFFFACSQPSQIGCLPYFHTWCNPSVNLGCRSETCCMWLAENTGRTPLATPLMLGTPWF